MNGPCPVCDLELLEPPAASHAYTCPRCGRFVLSGSLVASLAAIRASAPDASAKLSHVLRRASDSGDKGVLTTDMAKAIVIQPLPRPREQADLLLRWLAEHVAGPGETIPIEARTHAAITGSKSPQGFKLVVDHLFTSGLVTGARSQTLGPAGASAHATLTFEGWERYETLKRGGAVYRKAFMAMKFGDPTLERMLEQTFKPNVRQTGFDLAKLSDVPRAGLIDNRLRVEIQAADFVIADLTHGNLGAYWEAGYAEGLGKPVIYTCERAKFEATKTHFDTNHHLTIVWDEELPESAGEELKATIRATPPHLARQTDVEG